MANVGRPVELSPEQVAIIRTKLNNTNLNTLAKQFDVSHVTVRNAAKGKHPYNAVTDPPPLKKLPKQRYNKKTRLTPEFIQAVKDARHALIEQGIESGFNGMVAEQFGISNSYVSRICNGHYDEED